MTKKASKRLLPFTCWADVESADDVRGFRERFFLQDWDTARATRVLLKRRAANSQSRPSWSSS